MKDLRTRIKTILKEEFENYTIVYRGIGDRINATYGKGSDDGMGVFWTDNLTMAKWFAGLIDYSVDTDRYENIKGSKGMILTKEIKFDVSGTSLDWILTFSGKEIHVNSLLIYANTLLFTGDMDSIISLLINNKPGFGTFVQPVPPFSIGNTPDTLEILIEVHVGLSPSNTRDELDRPGSILEYFEPS
jgi:hypothetical protein